jgi:hypothetical protein
MKIKEAFSFFLLIAFISVAAGGDYYYSQIHPPRQGGYALRKADEQHKSKSPGNASQRMLPQDSAPIAASAVVYSH